jgi:tRNA dimethylallyltransferase
MLSANSDATSPNTIFLMGPTASGKTDLAVALAKHLPCDVISVDSALVYRGLDIGAAKPDNQTLAHTPHRLISFLDPLESYSAAQFRRDALREIADIHAHGRIPLLVGGTMLYFKVLLEGIADLPPADTDTRKALTDEAERLGWPAMHAKLALVDPESAARLHPNHSQRILRALEVHALTGSTLSALQQQQLPEPLPFKPIQLALMPADRNVLNNRIAQRFNRMLAEGFVDEVRALYQRGDLDANLPAIRAVGYRQVWDYLSGLINETQMREAGIAATRQLAKRQLTWLRSWKDLHWLLTEEPFDSEEVTQAALKLLERAGI